MMRRTSRSTVEESSSVRTRWSTARTGRSTDVRSRRSAVDVVGECVRLGDVEVRRLKVMMYAFVRTAGFEVLHFSV